MASLVGVSSIYQTPSVELSRRITQEKSTQFFAFKASNRFLFDGTPSSLRGFKHNPSLVSAAIATPNSVLSEEAFKGIGGFSKDPLLSGDEGEGSEEEYESETEAAAGIEDELAVSKLGLPRRLVETLENRGITNLFPIQV